MALFFVAMRIGVYALSRYLDRRQIPHLIFSIAAFFAVCFHFAWVLVNLHSGSKALYLGILIIGAYALCWYAVWLIRRRWSIKSLLISGVIYAGVVVIVLHGLQVINGDP